MTVKNNWSTGDPVTATQLNDNGTQLNTAMTNVTALQGMATNAVTATIATSQTTSSATWVDLSTPGPAVTTTVGASGLALVGFSAFMYSSTVNCQANMSFAVSGATTFAAAPYGAFYIAMQQGATGATDVQMASGVFLVPGLTPGSNTFTAKYQQGNGGTATFISRVIWVIPL